MDFNTITTLYAIGPFKCISDLTKSLLITENILDFDRIIPAPHNLKSVSIESTDDDLKKSREWRVDNWGTPSIGMVNSITQFYGLTEAALKIELATAFNEPTHIIDKIIQSNNNLEYFISYVGCYCDQYIGYIPKECNELKLLCEILCDDNYEDCNLNFNYENILMLKNLNMSGLRWKILFDSKIGQEVINNLQKIQ
jgi:hypothetical protein